MPTNRRPRMDATILGAASLLALAMGGGVQSTDTIGASPSPSVVNGGVAVADLAGTWASGDASVRLVLRLDGTYKRTIAGRDRVAHGSWRIDGLALRLHDDSGLRTKVTVYDGVLEMAGHRLTRV